MVAVQVNPKNRREHVMVLTAKGVKVAQAAHDILAGYHNPAFQLLSEKERQQLGSILQAMHQHYCQEGKPYACDLPWFSQLGQEVV